MHSSTAVTKSPSDKPALAGFDSIRFPFNVEPYLDSILHICCRFKPDWKSDDDRCVVGVSPIIRPVQFDSNLRSFNGAIFPIRYDNRCVVSPTTRLVQIDSSLRSLSGAIFPICYRAVMRSIVRRGTEKRHQR